MPDDALLCGPLVLLGAALVLLDGAGGLLGGLLGACPSHAKDATKAEGGATLCAMADALLD